MILKFKHRFLLLILILVYSTLVSAQPGEGKLYLIVTDSDGQTILFNKENNDSTNYKCFVIHGSSTSRNYSKNFYNYEGKELGMNILSIQRPIDEIWIGKNDDLMKIKFLNPPGLGVVMYINSIQFQPGVFELNCNQTKNKYVKHKKLGKVWDITPKYWKKKHK